MHCPDTSFLCALYRQQIHSESAVATLEAIGGPLVISSLLAYEFRQAVRFHVFLRSRDARKGYSETEGLMMLTQFENDLESGVLIEAVANGSEVAAIVEGSASLTP